MIIERHSLAKELPEFKDLIHDLKISDRHFAKLFNEYHDLDHQIIRIEEGIEVSDDDFIDGLKKQRLHLKDQLHLMLQKAK